MSQQTQPITVPQEIAEKIIGELRPDDDIRTLRSCALVSHSFLHPCHQHLYFTIYLDHRPLPQRLYELLNLNPDIAHYIRELYIVVGRVIEEEEDDQLIGEAFPSSIIGMLDRLQLLSLRYGIADDGFPEEWSWGVLSCDLQLALLNRCRSPSLNHMEFFYCCDLPISVIATIAVHCRKLTLNRVTFVDDSNQHPSFSSDSAELRALGLDLYDEVTVIPLKQAIPLLPLRNLRALSLLGRTAALSVAREITHCAKVEFILVRCDRDALYADCECLPAKFCGDDGPCCSSSTSMMILPSSTSFCGLWFHASKTMQLQA